MKAREVGTKGELEGPRRISSGEERYSVSFSGPRRKLVAKEASKSSPGCLGQSVPTFEKIQTAQASLGAPKEKKKHGNSPPVATQLCLGSSQVTGAKGENTGRKSEYFICYCVEDASENVLTF